MTDDEYMAIAFAEAKVAYERGEYPVGAVVTHQGQIIAQAGNRCVADTDPTAHAEMLVIRESYKKLKNLLSIHGSGVISLKNERSRNSGSSLKPPSGRKGNTGRRLT